MKLSIIIVNYNVKSFLEQCLLSVREASKNLETEVFVVDNHSVDDSVMMLKAKFPDVKLIENKVNVGFSKANNQAIRACTGDYVLLLNPDTVLEKDTLDKTLAFMDKTSDAGGLGVKMMDGKGRFLPESKRGLPTPSVAFYKIFGLSKLFPKSKRFGQYHLSYLNPDEVHEINVLAGAFMLLRHTVLDKIGLLDETFFMYGEDIDLSYRITQGGYKNYYFPETRIIHYKGESTKKTSVNYVIVFYKAMAIFSEKHFSKKQSKLLSYLIKLAIFARAFISLLYRFFKKIALPVLDFGVIYGGFRVIEYAWALYIHDNVMHFGAFYQSVIMPIYGLVWVLGFVFFKAYKTPVKWKNIVLGTLVSTVFILVVFALLGPDLRFSRALILLGGLWSFAAFFLIRFGLWNIGFSSFACSKKENVTYGIIGGDSEYKRVVDRLETSGQNIETVHLSVEVLNELPDVITVNKLDYLVFCTKDIPVQVVISAISKEKLSVDIKIAPENSNFLIGSQFVQEL